MAKIAKQGSSSDLTHARCASPTSVGSYPESFGGQGVDATVRVQAVDIFKLFNLNTIGSRGWLIGSSARSLLGTSTRLGYSDTQELSSARINRLLDAFGIPTADRTISTGDLQVQAGQTVDTNLLTALKAVESAEQEKSTEVDASEQESTKASKTEVDDKKSSEIEDSKIEVEEEPK